MSIFDLKNRMPGASQAAGNTQAAKTYEANKNMDTPTVIPSSAAGAPTAFASGAIVNRTNVTAGAGVLTLSATGTGANVKMQSPDNTVESINGTLGAEKFTVDQLPDRTGLALGGAALLGIDVLRAFLTVYAVYAQYIQYDGGSTGQLSNPIKFLTASPFGTLGTDQITPSSFTSNMQQTATLVDIRRQGGFILAGNTAIQLLVANTVTVHMNFMGCSLIPYNATF